MQKLTPDEIIEIAQNLQYLLYGLGAAGAVALTLLGLIARYIARQMSGWEAVERRVDDLDDRVIVVETRMSGHESAAARLQDHDSRLSLMEVICKRNHWNGR